MNYVPFLKFKVNEISALKKLSLGDKQRLTPFFDIARKDNLNSAELKSIIDKAYRKYEINLQPLPNFYIDNFDIDDSIFINGDDNYSYILDKFSDTKIIPVVGIDRSERRNDVVLEAKRDGKIILNSVALRISSEDIVSYTLIEDEINELFDTLGNYYDDYHLIIDNRVCHNIDIDNRADLIINFINAICDDLMFNKIIITGSSIPASISDLLGPNSEITIERSEVKVFNKVANEIDLAILGDYTTVSPNYSDVTIRGEYMRRVTAPKLIYSFDESTHIKRGGAIEGHPRGNKQYNDLSALLISEPFYRSATYSFGDTFLDEKANNIGNDATPSTIPKALINAHITFMLNDFA